MGEKPDGQRTDGQNHGKQRNWVGTGQGGVICNRRVWQRKIVLLISCMHARTIFTRAHSLQSMFSLSPSWSVTLSEVEKGATQSLDDEKNEEAVVIHRVKERINKVLQSRLAGEFCGARILALERT